MAENSDSESPIPRKIRTRKSDLVSGATMGVVLSLFGFVWKLRGDIQGIVESAVRAARADYAANIQETNRAFESAIQREKERAQNRESELQADIRELRVMLLTRRR